MVLCYFNESDVMTSHAEDQRCMAFHSVETRRLFLSLSLLFILLLLSHYCFILYLHDDSPSYDRLTDIRAQERQMKEFV